VSSNHIVSRRSAAALIAAFMVTAPLLGCGSDNGGNATTPPATTSAPPATTSAPPATTSAAPATTSAGAGTSSLGGDLIQGAKATICPELANLKTDLADVSANGTDAGQAAIARLGSLATAIQGIAATLTTAGAGDAATAATALASDLQSLAGSSGDDARASADQAAGEVQKLTDALQCP
jgi:hypothetical protein